MTECFKCGKEASYFRQYSGEHLCRKHFLTSIERKVARTIARHKMLQETDRIGVGVSGGKDSTVLLYILKNIEQRFPKSSLVAITIDEGVRGYRDESLKLAIQITSELGIEHHIKSFKEMCGYTLDSLVKLFKGAYSSPHTACFFCGILRRRSLNQTARSLNVNKLAIGHNLDDEAQTVMMNIVRSDIIRMGRTSLAPQEVHELFVPRIKPLREIPEREIATYAYFRDLPFHSQICPYAEGVLRNDIQHILNEMEQKRPGTKHAILRSGEKIKRLIQIKQEIHACPVCNEPATEKICKFCQIMRDLHKVTAKKI